MNVERIIRLADYYLENDITMKEVGEAFGISKKTVQNDLKLLAEVDPKKYALVEEKKATNLKNGAVKGGRNGSPSALNFGEHRRPYTINDADLEKIADAIIEGDLTLREVEQRYKIPKSTIHDNIPRLAEEKRNAVQDVQKCHVKR